MPLRRAGCPPLPGQDLVACSVLGKLAWFALILVYEMPMVGCSSAMPLRGQKSLGPLKMSLKMAHKVILPPKKNYIPQFLKQRDINSCFRPLSVLQVFSLVDIVVEKRNI
jgi:hypothetical protein